MKTLESLLHEAELRRDDWQMIYADDQALIDRNKTKAEASMLINYFEGRIDALLDAINIRRRENEKAN